jgi:hypothetical protein
MDKHSQFWAATSRYDGSEPLDGFERRVMAAVDAMFGNSV